MDKIDIDFQVLPTFNPEVLLVVDTSNWGHIIEKPSIIEITLPGEDSPYTHFFDKGKVNVFNSLNLNIHCSGCNPGIQMPLPDGIYQITVKGSPSTFSATRSFLKVDNLRLEIDKLIVSSEPCNSISKEFINKINRVNFLIEAAESHTRLGNFCQAQEIIFKVQKDIDRMKKCKTCV